MAFSLCRQFFSKSVVTVAQNRLIHSSCARHVLRPQIASVAGEGTVERQDRILREDIRVPIKPHKLAVFQGVAKARIGIQSFGLQDEFRVDRLVKMQEILWELSRKHNVRRSYAPIFIKAASMALEQYPMLNAHLDEGAENHMYKAAHNICVAVDSPAGLVMPNIKNCEQRSVWEIAAEMERLQEAASEQQLSTLDNSEGTFTLLNVGMSRGTVTPAIIPPQVAIGAITNIKSERKINAQEKVYEAYTLGVSWSVDHRVVDGPVVAAFSQAVEQSIEKLLDGL